MPNKSLLKRAASLFTALLMVIGLMPTAIIPAVFAADPPDTIDTRTKVLAPTPTPGMVSNPMGAYGDETPGNPSDPENATNKNVILSGNYQVTSDLTWTDVTVTGTTKLWVDLGKTLTIKGTHGNSPVNNWTSSTAGSMPNNASLIINSGITLTIEGPGSVVIEGPDGGSASNYGDGDTYRATKGTTLAAAGAAGASATKPAVEIQSGATLEFGKGLSGSVTITGGTGGRGGNAQDGASHTSTDTDTNSYYGGTGGSAGNGGNAITSLGNVIFNQDKGNSTLAKDGQYSVGTVNIKGGIGGQGGTGGDAGQSYTKIISAGTYHHTTGCDDNVGYNGNDDTYTTYPTVANTGGICGIGGIGISGGHIYFNNGVSAIEGGNYVSSISGTYGTTSPHDGSHNGLNQHVFGGYTTCMHYEQTGTNGDGQPIYGNVNHNDYVTISENEITCTSGGGTYTGSPNLAVNNATIHNNGGTSYLFYGRSEVSKAENITTKAIGGTSTVVADGDQTGSMYIGGFNGWTNSSTTNITAFQVKYLQGAKDFANVNLSKNLYVLNAGDTWKDANGDTHTSAGLVVNGNKTIETRDMFVSPQGYLYLTGVSADDTVSFDVAIGATLQGTAGDYPKTVVLSNGSQGVYHFSGKIGATNTNEMITARWALDNDSDGAGTSEEKSYDSSFDVYWLQGLKATNFSGEIAINTAAKLAAVAWAVNNGVAGAATASYKLTADLDLGSFDWTPIGTKGNPFEGTFNGANYSISNIRITRAIPGLTAYGLFGYAVGADIDNLTIKRNNFFTDYNKTIKVNEISAGNSSGGAYKVYDTHVITVKQPGDVFAGALVGHATNTDIDNVSVLRIDVTGESTGTDTKVAVGNVVGYADNSEAAQIKYEKLTMTGGSPDSGQGSAKAGTGLTTAKGGADTYAGGIIGYALNINLDQAYAQSVAVSATDAADKAWAGGIVGYIKDGDITKSAGSAGVNQGTSVTGYAYQTITATATNDAYVGGIAGQGINVNISGQTVTQLNTYKATADTGDAFAGGIAGHIQGKYNGYLTLGATANMVTGTTMSITAESTSTTGDKKAYAAGIVGYAEYTHVKNETVSGLQTVTATSGSSYAYAGGIAGYAYNVNNETTFTTFDNNTVTGATLAVTATSAPTVADKNAYAAGIVGFAPYAHLDGQSVTGLKSVTATSATSEAFAGGIAGHVKGTDNGSVFAVMGSSSATADKNSVAFVGDAKVEAKSNITSGNKNAYAGGAVGYAEYTHVKNEAVSGVKIVTAISESSEAFAGGIAGHVYGVSAQDKYAKIQGNQISSVSSSTLAVTANSAPDIANKNAYAGGSVGLSQFAHITGQQIASLSSVTADSATGEAFAGGIAGHLEIESNKPYAEVSGNTVTGSTLTIAANASSATADDKTAYAGGIVGLGVYANIDKQSITGLSSVAAASVKGEAYAGGIAGHAGGTMTRFVTLGQDADNANSVGGTNVEITAISSDPTEVMNAYAGGIVGLGDFAHVKNEAVSGLKTVEAKTVTGIAFAGGVAGHVKGVSAEGEYAIVSGNTVTGMTSPTGATVTAESQNDEEEMNAYAGGIVGLGQYVNVTGQTVGNLKEVKADSVMGIAFAGGVAGHVEIEQGKPYAKLDGNTVTGVTAGATVTADSQNDEDEMNAYAGGIVGLADYTNITSQTVNNLSVLTATAAFGEAFAGGIAGHVNIKDNMTYAQLEKNKVGGITLDITATAAGENMNAYAGGMVGLGDYVNFIGESTASVTGLKSITADSAVSEAFAGGVVGRTMGTIKNPAELRDLNVSGANAAILAKSRDGVEKNAYAGGILGFGLEAVTLNNHYQKDASGGSVKAFSATGTAWAGGHIGQITNAGAYKVSIYNTAINGVEIEASGGDTGNAFAGMQSYAGGVAGQIIAAQGAELTNIEVAGAANITSKGYLDAYAARLVGYATKATIIGCSFSNTSAVTVTASSETENVYAAGLAGKILYNGSINTSGLWMTNIDATGAPNRTAWVGGLLGYGDNTSINASSVNYKKTSTGDDVAGDFKTSSIDVAVASTIFAGGIAGEIVNTIGLGSADERTYKMNNAVSVTMTLPQTSKITAGGLYGKLNSALIGVSYARDYLISDDGSTQITASSNKIAGVVGELRGSELIAVYGVGRSGDEVITYPGMYHTGGNNKFYGTYALHSAFAVNPGKDGNTYANSFYMDTNAPDVNAIPDGKVTEADGKPYYMEVNGLYELMNTYGGKTFKYTALTAAPKSNFNNNNNVNDAMWTLLHFFKDVNQGAITTQYEKRLGISLKYNRKPSTGDLHYNFYDPMFVLPIDFTLAVMPGLSYGHIKENVPGQTPYSTYTIPGTRVFTPQTPLIFTAEEEPTLPKDDNFYAFAGWSLTSGGDKKTWTPESDVKSNVTSEDLENAVIRLVMPPSYMYLIANFKQEDNRIRAAINTAISKEMAALDGDVKDEIQDLLDAGDKDAALTLLVEAIFEDLEFLRVFDMHINGGTTTPYDGTTVAEYPYSSKDQNGKTMPVFEDVYTKAMKDTWNKLVDKEAVAKAIVWDALETVINRDNFVAGSYDVDVQTFERDESEKDALNGVGDKIDYVDIGAALFSAAGDFNKYVASQYAFEQSGVYDHISDIDNTKVGIASANGMEITIATLFNGVGDPLKTPKSSTYSHGELGGVYLSYTDPADTGKANINGILKDAAGELLLDDEGNPVSIWAEITADSDGKYRYVVDAEQLALNVSDDGKTYIYLREVDENGYAVTTRIEVTTSVIVSENLPVNDGEDNGQGGENQSTTNTGIGDGNAVGEGEALRNESLALWYGEVEMLKANPESTLTDVAIENVNVEDEGGNTYYTNGRGGAGQPVTHTTVPISGAYAQGIYLEIHPDLVDDKDAFLIANPNAVPVLDEDGVTVLYYEIPVVTNGTHDPIDTDVDVVTGLSYVPGDPSGTFTGELKDCEYFGYPVGDGGAAGDFMSGSFVYYPKEGIAVKTKYVNLIGEINAAWDAAQDADDETDGRAQVEAVVTDPHFPETMGITEEVMAVVEANPEYLEKAIDRLFKLIPDGDVDAGETNGYPGAQAVKEMFTYVVALQELVDVVDALKSPDGLVLTDINGDPIVDANGDPVAYFIGELTPADKTRLNEACALAEKLLEGNNPLTGDDLNPAQLKENLDFYYNTGKTIYDILTGAGYDTASVTVITNMPGFITPPAAAPSGQLALGSDTLYAEVDQVAVPQAMTRTLLGTLFSTESVLPKEYSGSLTTKTVVTKKAVNPTVTIKPAAAAAGYTFVAEYADEFGEVEAEGGIITLPKGKDVTITIIFTKIVYGADVPHIAYNDQDNNTSGQIATIPEPQTGKTKDVLDGDGNVEKVLPGVEHGGSLTFTIVPEEGYVLIPGAEVTYEMGGIEKTATVNPDGTVTIENVTGDIEVTDFSDAVKPYGNTLLDNYLDTLDTDYPDSDYTKYTPKTWDKLKKAINAAEEAIEAAETAKDAAVADPTNDDLQAALEEATQAAQEAYDDLLAAEAALVRMYAVTFGNNAGGVNAGDMLRFADLKNVNPNLPDSYPAGVEFDLLQNGLWLIDGTYYVQEGYNAVLESILPYGEEIETATYTQGSVSGLNAVLRPDGKVVISTVTGDVTLTATQKAKEFNAVLSLGDDPFKDATDAEKKSLTATGNKGTESADVVTLPNVTMSLPNDELENLLDATVTIVDANDNSFVITIELDENGKPTGKITVTLDDGDSATEDEAVTVTISPGVLDALVEVTDNLDVPVEDGTEAGKDITVMGDILPEIIDAYNKIAVKVSNDHTPILLESGKDVIGDLSFDADATDYDSDEDEKQTAPVTETVPNYTINPPVGWHTDEIVVGNDAAVTLPEDIGALIDEIIAGAEAGEDGYTVTQDGLDITYSWVDPETGESVTIEADVFGDVKSVTVDPGAGADYAVTFNTDLNDPNYGKATVTWKRGNKDNHVIKPKFSKNIYDVVVKVPENGDFISDKTTVKHGDSLTLTLTPNAGYMVDETGRITISVDAVQGGKDVLYSDSLENLKSNQYPNVTVSGPDANGGYIITLKQFSDSKANLNTSDAKGSLVVETDALLWLKNDSEANKDANLQTAIDSILLDLEELKKSIDLGEAIDLANPGDGVVYDTTNPTWNNFEDALAAADELYNDLTSNDGKYSVPNAENAEKLLKAINDLLGLTGDDALETLPEAVLAVSDAKDALDDAILKLTLKSGDTPVLPALNDEVGNDGGLSKGKKPSISSPADGGVSNTDNLVIEDVKTKPGRDVEAVVITVTDPDTGRVYEVSIPVVEAGDGELEEDLVAIEIDPDAGEPTGVEVPLDLVSKGDKGAVVSGTDGDQTVTVPGKTIKDIVDILTGGDGVVTGVDIDTGYDLGEGFDMLVDAPEAGAGIDGSGLNIEYSDDSEESDSPYLTPGEDGIKVTGIEPETDYEYKGIEIAITDKDGNPHTLYFPADGGNTTGGSAPYDDSDAPYTTIITADDLANAIKDLLDIGDEDLADITITDIKVVSDAVEVDVDASDITAGTGVKDSSTPSITAPTGGEGHLAPGENDDLTIENVQTEPGYTLDSVIIEITDPNTGESLWAEIPVTNGGDIDEDRPITVRNENGDEVAVLYGDEPGMPVFSDDKGASYDDTTGIVNVPAETISDIIEALKLNPDADIGGGILTGVVLEGKRDPGVILLPGAKTDPNTSGGKGITGNNDGTAPENADSGTLVSITDNTPDDTDDDDFTVDDITIILGGGEDLIIDDIAPDPGFTADSVEITVTNPITGEDITVTIPADCEEGTLTLPVTYVDEMGETHELTITVDIDADGEVDKGDGSTKGERITIPRETLEDILREAMAKALEDEFGPKAAEKSEDAYIDITNIVVNAKGGEQVVDVPYNAGNGKGISDKSVMTVTTPNDLTNGNTYSYDNGIPVNFPDAYPDNDKVDVVIEGVLPLPGYVTGSVELTLTYQNGVELTVTLPVGKTDWAENDPLAVELEGEAVGLTLTADMAALLNNIKAETEDDATDTVTIPGEAVIAIMDAIAEAYEAVVLAEGETLADYPAADITDIKVIGAREGYALPAESYPEVSTGVDSAGNIKKRPADTTENPALMDTTKGFDVEIDIASDVSAVTETTVEVKLPGLGGKSATLTLTITNPDPSDPNSETVVTYEVKDVNGTPIMITDDEGNLIADEDGNPVYAELAAALEVIAASAAESFAGFDSFGFTVPGAAAGAIYSATGVTNPSGVGKITVSNTDGVVPSAVVSDINLGVTLSGKLPSIIGDEPAAITPSEDLLVDNIKIASGYDLDSITLEVLTGDGDTYLITVPVDITYKDGKPYLVVTANGGPDGLNNETFDIDLSGLELPVNGDAIANGAPQLSVTIPGPVLTAIIDTVLDNVDGEEISDADIISITVNASHGGYIVPPAYDVALNGSEGLSGITFHNDPSHPKHPGNAEFSTAVIADVADSVGGYGGSILVMEQLTIELGFRQDDYPVLTPPNVNPAPTYHKLTHITFGDVAFSVEDLVNAQVIEFIQGGHSIYDLTSPGAIIVMDIPKMIDCVAAVILERADATPVEAEAAFFANGGFDVMSFVTVPQNIQYSSFLEDYERLEGMLENEALDVKNISDPYDTNRQAYEDLVAKLLDQFTGGPAGIGPNENALSQDNMDHLLDHKAQLQKLQAEIDARRAAENNIRDIHDVFDVLHGLLPIDIDVPGTDEGPGSECYIENIDDAIDFIKHFEDTPENPATDADRQAYQELKGLIEGLEDRILKAKDDNGKLNDLGKFIVGKDDSQSQTAEANGGNDGADYELARLEELLGALKLAELGDEGYFNYLVSNLNGAVPDIVFDPVVPGNSDSIKDNTNKSGLLSDRINELAAWEQKLANLQSVYDNLTPTQKANVADAYNIVLGLQNEVNEGYVNLAEVFARDYLTTRNDAYDANGTTSADSNNGIKETTPKIRDLATTAYDMYQTLPQSAIDAIDALFYGPTVPELREKVLKPVPTSVLDFVTEAEKEAALASVREKYDQMVRDYGSQYTTAERAALDKDLRDAETAIKNAIFREELDSIVAHWIEELGENIPVNRPVTPPVINPPGGGGGGGAPSPNVIISKDGMGEGAVTIQPEFPVKGDEVIITVTPDKGYVLESLSIKDENGKPIEFTDNGDGTYTYIQPDGVVTVNATFQPTVIIIPPRNGSISIQPSLPVQGDTVTVTVRPNKGFVLGSLSITDKDGNAVDYIDNGDGTYTYIQPDGTVTVTAAFVIKPVDDSDVSGLLITDDHIAYVRGRGDQLFAPDADMTRAEVAQMLFNLLRNKDVHTNLGFDDIPEDAWYAEAVYALASLGIITGYPDGSFQPNKAISRTEFAAMVTRFAKLKESDVQFDDVTTQHWAYKYINTAAGFGWILGKGNNLFDPNNNIKRSEVITLTNRVLKRSGDEARIDSDESLIRYNDVTAEHWAYYDIMEASNAHDYDRDEDSTETWK